MIILKQFATIAADKLINEEDGNVPKAELIGKQKATEFYIEQNMTALIRFLVMDYLQLSQDDLELWEDSPEEYMTEEKQEVWKYDVRPCSEVLLLSLVHNFQKILVPVLVSMVSEVQNVILPKIDHSKVDFGAEIDQNCLIADAVLNAIGLASYELAEEVDFDSWFTSTLAPLAQQTKSKILKRRVAWLLSQWVGVKFSGELRPMLYKLLLGTIQSSTDIVVRLEAALALKITIDDFSFESNQFQEFQGWIS